MKRKIIKTVYQFTELRGILLNFVGLQTLEKLEKFSPNSVFLGKEIYGRLRVCETKKIMNPGLMLGLQEVSFFSLTLKRFEFTA